MTFPDIGPDLKARMPQLRGRLLANQSLAELTWFRVGGPAQVLFMPEDEADLSYLLAHLSPDIPVTVIGLGSNLIIRDGGVPGVVIRLGRGFSDIVVEEGTRIRTGTAVPDVKVARAAQEAAIAGLSFLRGIPGAIGGALRMNGGAYGGETKDALVSARGVDRAGRIRTYTNADPVSGAPRYQFPAPFYTATTQQFIGASDFYQNTPTNYRDPQTAQWNLTVERELPGNMALRVSYVGMNSYRMNLTVDLNQTRPGTQPYNPALKPYQNWNRILSSENLGFGNYQALQTELNRRLSKGLSFQASYTWAKNLANYGGDAPSGFAPEVIYGTAVNDRFSLQNESRQRGRDQKAAFSLIGNL